MIEVNRNGLYIYNENEDGPLTLEKVEEFILDYDGEKPKFIRNRDAYMGEYEILRRKKEEHKPNNKLVVNFAKYIVDTFNGYFIGVPVKESHYDESVNAFMQDFIKRNDLQDNEAEISKISSIYGRAFEYIYRDGNETKATYLTPLDGFMIYDDTIAENPLFFVRYWRDSEQKLHGEVLSQTEKRSFNSFDSPETHYFSGVPVVEYIENEERQGVFDNVMTLINALNNALSEKANDIEYFADAYLVLRSLEAMEESEFDDIRRKKIINLWGELAAKFDAYFLEKPDADTTQENLIDRLIDLIYQTAMIANVSDETFSTASSGTALEFKLLPMKNLALNKERKFQAGLRKRWELVFSIDSKKKTVPAGAWADIEYKFTRNIPANMESEAEVMSKLATVVSKETQLGTASFIPDVQAEIERLKAERQELLDEGTRDYDMTYENDTEEETEETA